MDSNTASTVLYNKHWLIFYNKNLGTRSESIIYVYIWHEMKYSFIIFKKEKNLVHHMSKDLSSMESKYDFQIDKLIGYRCLTGQLNQNFCIDMLLLSYNKH